MDFAGKINPISLDNAPGLQSVFYYYGYYYALQTVVGEGISS